MLSTTPVKILYLMTTLGKGGTERNAITFCEYIDRERFLPEIWYLHEMPDSYKNRALSMGIELKHLDAPKERSISYLFRTAKKLAQADAGLIHVFLPSVGYYAALSKLRYRNPIPMLFSAGGTHTELPFQKWMYRFGIARYCDPVLCNSEAVKQFMLSMHIPESKLRVIPNGHELSKFELSPDRNELFAELGIDSSVPTAICVGRFIDTKRQIDLIDATLILREQGLKIQVIFVGNGPLEESMKQHVREANLGSQILFLGQRNDVPRLLLSADLFAFPSETEGLPNAVIEAALAKLPIIGCDARGVRGTIENNKTGILISTRNPTEMAGAIRRIVEDPEFASSIAANANTVATEKYDIKSIIRQIESVYQEVIDRGSK